ncbi:MAG: hypothetical protein AAF532_11000 [Planctomycetota bacterium]
MSVTLATAATVSAVALGYTQLARLLVGDTAERVAPVAEGADAEILPPPPEKQIVANEHLAHVPWAESASHFVRTDRLLMYANGWDLGPENKSVDCAPLAVVFRNPPGAEDSSRGPLVLTAKAARLRFVKPIGPEAEGGSSRINSAVFKGPVRIDGADGLNVTVAGDVAYDEAASKFWSDAPVTVTRGDHRGSGRGFELELFAVGTPGQFETFAVSGVKTARLLRDVRFEARPDGGDADRPGVPVVVTSRGSFTFDLDDNHGLFVDDVVVTRRPSGGDAETLDCDRLEIELAPKDPVAAAARRERVGRTLPGEFITEPIDPDLELRRLIATGDSVVLASPARGLTVFATEAVHDLAAGKMRATHPGKVKIVRDRTVVLCPEVTIDVDADGVPGEVVGHGAGELRQFAEQTPTVRLITRWSERVVRPVPAVPGREEIRLFGRPRVDGVEPDGSPGPTLEADMLTIFLTSDGEPPADDAEDPLGGGSLKPRQLRAVGDVRLRSERFAADTPELTVDLVDPEPDRAVSGDAGRSMSVAHSFSPDALRLGLSTVTTTPRVFASVPTAVTARRVAPRSARNTDGPILAKADAIFVTAVGDFSALGGQAEDETKPNDSGKSGLDALREIRAVGNVRVRQDHVDGREPLDVSGDELRLVGEGGERQTVHVVGAPAHLREGMSSGQVHVQADRVHLDRSADRIWVDGPGLLELPIDPATTGPGIRHDGRLDVWWEESMEFDGRIATFRERVRTVFGDNRLACPSMRVVLDRAIDFGAPPDDAGDPANGRPQLAGVICEGGVVIDGFMTDPEGDAAATSDAGQSGVYHAEFASLVYKHATGETLGEGPGHLDLWQRGDADRAGLAAGAVVVANAPADRADVGWNEARVDFVGQLRGFVQKQEATFDRRVTVITGPVEGPGGRLDPDDLPIEAAWMQCQELTLSRHESRAEPAARRAEPIVPTGMSDALSAGGSAHLELRAEGNVEIEGRMQGARTASELFFARGDLVTFDQSKGLYTLRGVEDREASIARDDSGGEVHARTIWFVPATRKVVLDQISGFSGAP